MMRLNEKLKNLLFTLFVTAFLDKIQEEWVRKFVGIPKLWNKFLNVQLKHNKKLYHLG